MKKIKQISISDYKPNSSSMINRHYYFNIQITFEDDSDKILNKRYSEIEELYKILLLKYPGCRIPKFPSKSFMMNIHIKEEEKKDIINKIEKFLRHLINHKILSEKNAVNDFFSNEKLNKNKDLKTDLMNISEDDNINNSDFNVNEDLNQSDANKNDDIESFIKEFEEIDFKNSEYYETWYENKLINMFLEEENNEKKGIIDKTKGVLSSIYNYLFTGYSQDLSLNSNNLSENTISDSYFQEENVKYLEKISKDLGEEDYLKEYGKQIMKINEGLSYLYNNYTNIQNFNQKKLNSLSNIKKLCNDNMEYIDTKEEKKDEIIDETNIILNNKTDKYEKKDKKIFDNEVNKKLEYYISINSEFYEKEMKEKLEKINDNKIIVEELKEIYDRKKSHINFLMKLISNHNELDKKRKIEPNNKTINKEYEHVKKYLDIEIDFIKKLNQDLKYEIDFFKENIENNVYKYINEMYINKYNKQIEIFNKLNEYISLESDSENSSKEENFEFIETNNIKNNSEENSKIKQKERNNSVNSKDDF